MLLRHSGMYALARGFPGLVNVLAIGAFSRLLSPEAYGHYALVVAGVGLANVVAFQWLRLCLLRFLPANEEQPEWLLSPIASAFAVAAGITGLGGLIALLVLEDPTWRTLVAVGVVLLWTQAWFELNRDLARTRLSPVRYGLLSGTKAVTALAVGVCLVLAGLGGLGALLGLLVGLVLAPVAFSRHEWKGVRLGRLPLDRYGYLLAYGLPLAVNFALVWIIASSDRLLLGWLLDVDSAGLYAVGYDLAQQSLGLVLMIVNLAAYPLVVRALEREGTEAARGELERNAGLLLAVAVPGAVGLALLAPGIAEVFVGPDFRAAAATLIPWIAAGALLAGLKSYHFDLAFQLGRRTLFQVWISLLAAAANLSLNLLWIPRFGLLGAAYATVVSYGVALMGSAAAGRLAFRIPWNWTGAVKVLATTTVMASVLLVGPGGVGATGLLVQVLMGASVYGIVAVWLDIGGLRTPARKWLSKAWSAVS